MHLYLYLNSLIKLTEFILKVFSNINELRRKLPLLDSGVLAKVTSDGK
jgi:hypothetical protein